VFKKGILGKALKQLILVTVPAVSDGVAKAHVSGIVCKAKPSITTMRIKLGTSGRA
jgi:hypothetical protein